MPKNLQGPESIEDLKREFDEFSYIVSHDLNAPVRHIKHFSAMLAEEREALGPLNENEQEYVRFLNSSIQKLEQRLIALTLYSRVNTRGKPFEVCSPTKIVQEYISTLPSEEQAIFTVGNIPDVMADADQLYTVLESLIDNALKFSIRTPNNENKAYKIIISAENDTDEKFVRIYIRDFGIGLEEKYYDDVFQMFRTLTVEEKSTGIGSGLAIARKIIRRHGGEIHFENPNKTSSEPAQKDGEGCLLTFTLPRASL